MSPVALEKTLPSEYYRSPEIYARERERIFCREWICVGRESELPGRGSEGGVVGGKRIRCPYHSWTYSLDGELIATPYIEGLDRTKLSLYPVGVETWGGFIFVHLMPAVAKSLA